jgi:hypothetical protein
VTGAQLTSGSRLARFLQTAEKTGSIASALSVLRMPLSTSADQQQASRGLEELHCRKQIQC